jgi:hypothetical protein
MHQLNIQIDEKLVKTIIHKSVNSINVTAFKNLLAKTALFQAIALLC